VGCFASGRDLLRQRLCGRRGRGVEAADRQHRQSRGRGHPLTGPGPKLVQFLPGKEFGLVDKSTRYLKSHVLLNQRFFIAHQNILNLSRKTEAALAVICGRAEGPSSFYRYPMQMKPEFPLESFRKSFMPDAGGRTGLKTEGWKWTFARHRMIAFCWFQRPHGKRRRSPVKDNRGKTYN